MGKLADNIDIMDVVHRYGIVVDGSGSRLRGPCPLHDDSSPSFDVDPIRQTFHCWGCQQRGDALDLIRALEGLSTIADALRVAEDLRLARADPVPRREPPPPRTLTADELQALECATALYAEALVKGDAGAEEYLRQRGVGLEFARQRRLGICRRGSSGRLVAALQQAGIPVEAAITAGLLTRTAKFELMNDRLVLPHIEQGQVTWLCGRLADTVQWRERMEAKAAAKQAEIDHLDRELEASTDEDERSEIADEMWDKQEHIKWMLNPPKYLNVLGVKPLFWRPPSSSNTVVLVEGPMDAVVLRQWGIPAAAVLGSHISRHQLGQLQGIPWIAIARDGGANGLEFAKGWAEQLTKAEKLGVRIIDPPQGADDPADVALLPDAETVALQVYGVMSASGNLPDLGSGPPTTPKAYEVGTPTRLQMVACPACGCLVLGSSLTLACCGRELKSGDSITFVTIEGEIVAQQKRKVS